MATRDKLDLADLRRQYDLALPHSRLNPRIIAAGIGVSFLTLEKWRCEGKGPVFHKLDGRVFYLKSEVEDWIAEREAA